jgi:hypothetical protein
MAPADRDLIPGIQTDARAHPTLYPSRFFTQGAPPRSKSKIHQLEKTDVPGLYWPVIPEKITDL